jgi:predicted alpha/beta-hydrolase family hydrolase
MHTHHSDETRLLSDVLGAPRKIARIEAESAELLRAAADTDGVDALGTKFCARGLAAELELALLAVVCALRARCGALVARFTGDTYRAGRRKRRFVEFLRELERQGSSKSAPIVRSRS